MESNRLSEIANGIRKALKAQDSGEYSIGDVRAFQKEDAFAIVEALEYCADIDGNTGDENLTHSPNEGRYVYFVKLKAMHVDDECRISIEGRMAAGIHDGLCIVDDGAYEIYAFDKKKGRAVKIV